MKKALIFTLPIILLLGLSQEVASRHKTRLQTFAKSLQG